jgi:hypothetical protein
VGAQARREKLPNSTFMMPARKFPAELSPSLVGLQDSLSGWRAAFGPLASFLKQGASQGVIAPGRRMTR